VTRAPAQPVALVTGGGRGIGREIALALAREGCHVAVAARSSDQVDATAAAVANLGVRTVPLVLDVTDEGGIARGVAAIAASLGPVDVLVNNAGIAEEKPFLEIEDSGWDAVIATNLRGAFMMAQRVARVQVDAGGGCIIHIASIDGSGGDGPYASYNASKAGLLGLNRTMALELGPLGVRVNCVSPGFTHTEMTEVGVPPGMMDYLSTSFDRVPLRRLVRPEEIAAACAFLASDDASAITGVDLTVDCGLTANWYILESIPDHA